MQDTGKSEDKNRQRILVVDDNEQNVRLLKSTLAKQGYEIVVAHDGQQALERVAEMPPDLIMLDVIMPKMDGFGVAHALRARDETRAIPILMVTALHDLQDKIKGFEAGADDFVSKPFNRVELLARVRSLLRIKQLHDEVQTRNKLLEHMLMRYVSDDVAREILDHPDQDLRLGGQSCEVSVLFANIRGFDHFSQGREACQVTQVLNQIFHHLAAAIFEYDGTLDKYLGSAIMAFFGAPLSSPNDPERALRTAWAMQRRVSRLQRKSPALGELGLSIGICSGEAVVGNVGTERMMDYTVIGHTPNAARRLEEHAQAGQILIDEHTYQASRDVMMARQFETLLLNGSRQAVQTFEVVAVREPIKI
jgi:class 3 adenylate cyclase